MPEENFEIDLSVEDETHDICEGGCKVTFGFEGNYVDLLNEVSTAELMYIKCRQEYESAEADLWLYTDWETVLDNKKPTQKDKEFWIRKQLIPLKESLNNADMHLKDCRRMFDIAYKYSLEVLR